MRRNIPAYEPDHVKALNWNFWLLVGLAAVSLLISSTAYAQDWRNVFNACRTIPECRPNG